MKFTSRVACIVLLASFVSPLHAQPSGPSAPSSDPARLDLRESSFIDLHFYIRAQGDEPAYSRGEAFADAHALAALNAAVDAAERLQSDLGGERGWGLIEPLLAQCTSAADAVAACGNLPESFKPASGGEVQLRDGAVALATAYSAIEPAFLETVWPRHREQIEGARLGLTRDLLKKQDQCFEFITTSLAMNVSDLTVPVYLVAESPAPGGFTHRQRGGGGVCFIGVEHASGSLLDEVVLHESIHVLDLATQSQDTVLQVLRRKLVENGVPRTDSAWRDLPHTLMFVQAGETVRRLLDESHRDYGEVAGYYDKVPEAAACVRPAWRHHLEGAATAPEAIDEMVRALLARREQPEP